MQQLTEKQKNILDFIYQHGEEEGYTPTYREIAANFGFSSDGTVKTHLDLLAKKGCILLQGKARGIKILKPPTPKYIPIVGQIAAGLPITAIENYIGSLNDISELKYQYGRIALTIKGDSMIKAGINPGDIVVIQTKVPVSNGEIAAVRIENEATIKRIFFEQNQIRLKAENEHYDDIVLTKNDYDSQIIGKYIALVRRV
ncbi:transcriptional repressor LexA [Candidatus Margulisiibacteriota bacterium]